MSSTPRRRRRTRARPEQFAPVDRDPPSWSRKRGADDPHGRVERDAENEENLATARAYLEGRGPFPERAALNQLGGRFLTELYATVARWVVWAEDMVTDWPDDVREAPFDTIAGHESVERAESIAAVLERG